MKDEEAGGNNLTGAISRAKLQSNHHHFHRSDALPVLRPTNSVRAPKEDIYITLHTNLYRALHVNSQVNLEC